MPHTKGLEHVRIHLHGKTKRRRKREPSGGPENLPDSMVCYREPYLEALEVKHYSEHTVYHRRQYLDYFFTWAYQRDIVRPHDITKPILESYQRWLYRYRKKNGKPLGIRSQKERLMAVKDYFRWLCKKNILLSNPASELEMPRSEKQLPVESLGVADVERVMRAPDLSNPLGIRDRAVLEMLYSTGMRRMEVVKVQITDLNHERKTVFIRLGKGRKDRVVPIGQRALSWIERYLDDVRPHLVVDPNEKTLFLSGYGQAFSKDVLGRMVCAYVRKGCPGRKGGCHLLRHTCATHMLDNGADTRFIQQLLGHASLETTQIYTQVSIKQLQEVHTRTHPASQNV